jgi:hypothetical protein
VDSFENLVLAIKAGRQVNFGQKNIGHTTEI